MIYPRKNDGFYQSILDWLETTMWQNPWLDFFAYRCLDSIVGQNPGTQTVPQVVADIAG
jgi:hypothetical protein